MSRGARAAVKVTQRAPRCRHRAGIPAGILPPAGHRSGPDAGCAARRAVQQADPGRSGRTAGSEDPGAQCLIIPISEGWSHEISRSETPHSPRLRAGSYQDLSLKRNLGLLLARLHGWNKIAFVDDDITLSGPRISHDWPDNWRAPGRRHGRATSIRTTLWSATRGAWLGSQDVFVTGAVLGVHCNNLPLSFFPDIYNEDWFFFAREAAARKLPRVGPARQARVRPLCQSRRARREEFGDLLAEGLFALFGDASPEMSFDEQLRGSDEPSGSGSSRRVECADTEPHRSGTLRQAGSGRPTRFLCLATLGPLRRLGTVTPGLCVDFLDAWRQDLGDWQSGSRAGSTMSGAPARRWTSWN